MNRKYRTTGTLRPGQRGVGMIEVLVAVLVLAIGLLGLVGLQVRSLQNNRSASERAIAVAETHSIIDAMRADRAKAMGNGYNIDFADATPTPGNFRDTAIAQWRNNLVAMLGAGATGKISCNGTDCTISVKWNDSRASRGDSAFTITTEVQL